jgi:hypothetical protein
MRPVRAGAGQVIEYRVPDARAVTLVWGTSGWQKAARTPMTCAEDRCTARLGVPAGTPLDFGFQIEAVSRAGASVTAWDGRGTIPDDYHAVASSTPLVIDASAAARRALAAQVAPYRPYTQAPRAWAQLGVWVAALLTLLWSGRLMRLEVSARTALTCVLVLTAVGLMLRLEAAGRPARLLVEPFRTVGDETRYDWLALELLRGNFFPYPAAMPVYPAFMAACYKAFGYSFAVVLKAQAVVSASTVPLTYALARRFTGRFAACVAALIAAVEPNLVNHSARLYTEAVYVPLLLLAVWALTLAADDGAPRAGSGPRLAWAGAAMSLATLCRPTTGVFPLVVPLILPRAWPRRRRLAGWLIYGAAMAAVLAPWAAHNTRTHGTFIPFGFNLATLYQGSPEFYHKMQARPNAMAWIWDEDLNPTRGGPDIATVEGDRQVNARAMASIRNEPLTYAWYGLQKLAYFWIGHPADLSDWPFDPRALSAYYAPRHAISLMGSRLLMVLAGLIAVWSLRRRWREFRAPLAVCGYLTVMHALLVPLGRHSEPHRLTRR